MKSNQIHGYKTRRGNSLSLNIVEHISGGFPFPIKFQRISSLLFLASLRRKLNCLLPMTTLKIRAFRLAKGLILKVSSFI